MSRTNCCRAFLLALLATAILAAPAFAQNNCMADVSKANSCTAGDVSTAGVLSNSVNVYSGGIPGTNQCIEHSQFSFTATFEIKTTSSSTRSNIGVFFGTGQSNALHGTCTNQILAPQHPCAYVNGVSTATCGDAEYEENDFSKNGETGSTATQASCGDTSANDTSAQFGAGTHAATLSVQNVTCPAAGSTCPAGSGINGSCLVLPVCTSWYQPANGMPVCESPVETAPTESYPWVAAAIPGAPSKCTCGVLYVPVTPVTVSPLVGKACNTNITATSPTFDYSGTTGQGSPSSCDAGAEGSTVTYTVGIKSTATLANNNTVVDQICDNVYGTIYRATGFTGPACPAGQKGYDGTATNGTCPPAPIAPGASATCTFTAPVLENVTGVTDTLSVSGHSSLDTTATFTNIQSNSVTVTSSDAPSTETTTKSVNGLIAGCATVRFNVDVHNSSGADENLTLTGLTDSSFGDITSVHGNIQGTTCGVANGLGTLAGTGNGAGILPATLTVGGSDYQCKFDGQICGTLATITLPNGGGTCQGLTNTDTVTPTINGDEGASDKVSHTDNTITADVCFTHTP